MSGMFNPYGVALFVIGAATALFELMLKTDGWAGA
jgi:hypothetical protein